MVDNGVMADVYTFHDAIAIAYLCFVTSVGGTVYHDVFANDVLVADNQFGLVSTEFKILGEGLPGQFLDARCYSYPCECRSLHW